MVQNYKLGVNKDPIKYTKMQGINTTVFAANSTIKQLEQTSAPQFYGLTVSYSTLAVGLALFLAYAFYFYMYREAEFLIKPAYDTKRKHMGKPLPPYPNGWYVACNSSELKKGQSRPCDIAGENIVLFRSQEGVVHALHAYCAHMGAHLGIGGKVVNKQCIQCPFHGWIYDGETGTCVDMTGKPLKMRTAEYNEGFCKHDGKLKWDEGEEDQVSLRKYPVQEFNNLIYVWIHSVKEFQNKPTYDNINVEGIKKNLEFRGKTKHFINCHIQDIPENGSDILHFRYVHTQIIPGISWLGFNWKAKWMRGDDKNLADIFEHEKAYIREFKQQIFKDYIQPFKDKTYLSVGYIDNYIRLPILGECFMFNATVVQYGPSTVFIFLRSPLYKIVFQQYLQPEDKAQQLVVHEMYTNRYIPYWLSALALKLEGDQVTNDMRLWESKKFAHKLYYRKGVEYDDFLQKWREWYSVFYQGCENQLKPKEDYSW